MAKSTLIILIASALLRFSLVDWLSYNQGAALALGGTPSENPADAVNLSSKTFRKDADSTAQVYNLADEVSCDGISDAGLAINQALRRLPRGRMPILQLPPGICRILSPIVIENFSVILQGHGFTEGPGTEIGSGTQILIDRQGFTPITVTGPLSRGTVFRDFSIRELQPALSGASWQPADYGFVFKIENAIGEVGFANILFQGVTRGIYSSNSGRMNIESIRGQFYKVGIEIDDCYDIPRINYLHVWPFVTSDARVLSWEQRELDAIILRRVDGVFLGDIFVFGANSAIYMSYGRHGVATKVYISNLYADFSRYAILVDGANSTFQAANVTTQHEDFTLRGAPLVGGTGILINTNGVIGQVSNWRTDIAEGAPFKFWGRKNVLQLGSLQFSGLKSAEHGAKIYETIDGKEDENSFNLALPPISPPIKH